MMLGIQGPEEKAEKSGQKVLWDVQLTSSRSLSTSSCCQTSLRSDTTGMSLLTIT
jgi:hypothetical protein